MRKARTFLPPPDGQEWVTLNEGAEMVGLTWKYFSRVTKAWDFTSRRESRAAPRWYLRSEVAKWAELRGMRQRWLKTHPRSSRYPRWTEAVDAKWAQGIFIDTKEAAAILRVAVVTVYGLVRRGRLVCYQSRPGHQGARLWFSRRAVEQLNEDEARAKCQAAYKKGKEGWAGANRYKTQLPRKTRTKLPDGWLTAREAAERLGVHPNRVRELRETGRLRGERLWRKKGWQKFWYIPVWEVEKLLEDEGYLAIRARWRAAQEKRKGSLIDKIQMGRPKTLTCDEDLMYALRPMFTSDIWKLPPEPDWACDRRKL